MARQVARGRARGGGLRQRTDWARIVIADAVAVAAATKVVLATFLHGQEEATIRRSILTFSVMSDQNTVNEDQLGAVGIYVASDQAVAVGVTGLLGPVTDASDDVWLLWEPIVQRGGAAGAEDTFAGHQYHVDSRGQRRLQEGQQAVLMVENASATEALLITMGASVLFGSGLQR